MQALLEFHFNLVVVRAKYLTVRDTIQNYKAHDQPKFSQAFFSLSSKQKYHKAQTVTIIFKNITGAF